jgi:hypothetical protein
VEDWCVVSLASVAASMMSMMSMMSKAPTQPTTTAAAVDRLVNRRSSRPRDQQFAPSCCLRVPTKASRGAPSVAVLTVSRAPAMSPEEPVMSTASPVPPSRSGSMTWPGARWVPMSTASRAQSAAMSRASHGQPRAAYRLSREWMVAESTS